MSEEQTQSLSMSQMIVSKKRVIVMWYIRWEYEGEYICLKM